MKPAQDGLAERLRDDGANWTQLPITDTPTHQLIATWNATTRELEIAAADHIESQAKRIEELDRQVSYYESENAHIVTLHASIEELERDLVEEKTANDEMRDRAEQAERALADAREETRKQLQHTEYWRDQSVKNVGRVEQLQQLLREWRSTELDYLDEDFTPWLEQFTKKVDELLSGHAHAQTAEPKE